MNFLIQLSRILLGALFIFSGFVKSVDPLGTSYKIFDYFKAGGAPIPDEIALTLAIALCSAELFIGLALLFNIRVKVVSWFSLIFMAVFTVLTLILALTNKVADCGCFGDAFKLTNWQTFYKNLIILPFAIVVFWHRKRFKDGLALIISWLIFFLLIGISLWFNLYNIKHLPLINYRPYKIGQNIWMGMQAPRNAPADVYDIKLVYQKNGVKKEFNENNFPWQDTSWTFVEQRTTLVKRGYQTPIHDFSIQSREGDITEKVLKKRGAQFLFVSPNLESINLDNAQKANAIFAECQKQNIPFICLTSTTGEKVEEYRSKSQALYPIYATDETTLKTVMRSNPGLMMLYDGTIVGMWSGYDMPGPNFIKGNILGKQLKIMDYQKEELIIILLLSSILIFSVILSFLRSFGR